MSDLLLVGHGSRDPRAQAATDELAAAVQRSLAASAAGALGDVRVGVGYLELAEPSVGAALEELRRPVIVQPLLFAPAYHATDDLPRQLAGREGVVLAPVLAPDPAAADGVAPLLLAALDRRLREALRSTPDQPDGLVLVSAGTSYADARAFLDGLAATWAARHGVRGVAAYASMAPDAGAQVRALSDRGCQRVAVGSLFVAPGRLPSAAREAALAAGAVAVADPLAAAPELVELIAARFRAHA